MRKQLRYGSIEQEPCTSDGADTEPMEPGYRVLMRFLEQIERADRITDCYAEALLKLKEKATRAVASAGSDFGGEPNPQKTEKLLVEIWDLEETFNEALSELMEMQAFCVALIRTVEDPLAASVLAYRYVTFLSFESIAQRMGISDRSVRRAHKTALRQAARQLKEYGAKMPVSGEK